MFTESSQNEQPERDWVGVIFAGILGAVGLVAVLKTEGISPLGAVFPTTVGTATAVFAVLYILLALLKPAGKSSGGGDGSWWRRVGLVTVMLSWVVLLPWIGFLAASVAGFCGMILVGNYDRWTPKRVLIYAITSAALIGGFYLLFAVALSVPLPEARLLRP